ncbi:MAG: TonB-dependent receptor [Phycisphaerae bacterium]|nr:TonB-dependent receptor [Saprospiraceae bacterium]
MNRRILETEQKALEINLDERVYGAFAEIGAGQEVARHFFQAGAAAGTIAKTMSAYDKVVSDEIYGAEEHGKGRYVCESRLYKMLAHEYALMEGRLRTLRSEQCFFAFADTVAAINYQKTIKGDGWLGLRFQLNPHSKPNDLVLHVRLLDQDNRLQQQAVGILGVNMLYACFRYQNDPETLLRSLMDNLFGRVKIDMVRLKGPDFQQLDNRLLCLWLVKNQLSEVAIFGPDGDSLHAGEFLYKKSILVARGSYRPPTLVQEDMIRCAREQFLAEADVNANNAFVLAEITLDNLRADGELSERDFLDRAEILCALGQTVIISDCIQHKRLIAYFADYKIPHIGLAMGARKLQNILHETSDANPDNLLVAFGEVFPRNVRFYIYPCLPALPAEARSAKEGSPTPTQFNSSAEAKQAGTKAVQNLTTSRNLPIPQAIHFLYDHLLENRNIVDIHEFNPAILDIYHKEVLNMIQNGATGWEEKVPPEVARLIKEKRLFGDWFIGD